MVPVVVAPDDGVNVLWLDAYDAAVIFFEDFGDILLDGDVEGCCFQLFQERRGECFAPVFAHAQVEENVPVLARVGDEEGEGGTVYGGVACDLRVDDEFCGEFDAGGAALLCFLVRLEQLSRMNDVARGDHVRVDDDAAFLYGR